MNKNDVKLSKYYNICPGDDSVTFKNKYIVTNDDVLDTIVNTYGLVDVKDKNSLPSTESRGLIEDGVIKYSQIVPENGRNIRLTRTAFIKQKNHLGWLVLHDSVTDTAAGLHTVSASKFIENVSVFKIKYNNFFTGGEIEKVQSKFNSGYGDPNLLMGLNSFRKYANNQISLSKSSN